MPKTNYVNYFRFGAWVGEGTNWCSPYKGWQKIYDNSPKQILEKQDIPQEYNHLILGKNIFPYEYQFIASKILY